MYNDVNSDYVACSGLVIVAAPAPATDAHKLVFLLCFNLKKKKSFGKSAPHGQTCTHTQVVEQRKLFFCLPQHKKNTNGIDWHSISCLLICLFVISPLIAYLTASQ